MRGRKPKPTEQKRREGNPGKRQLPAPVTVAGRVVGPDDTPEPPAHLTEEGVELFVSWRDLLVGLGTFDKADVPALCGMVEAELEARAAYEALQLEGHTIRGDRSEAVPHPAYKIWRDSRKLMLQHAEHFGFTPVARARLGLAGLMGRALAQELDLPPHPRTRNGG